jgi:hypothetical protein
MNGVSDEHLEETETQFRCAVNGMILCSSTSFILSFIELFLFCNFSGGLSFPPKGQSLALLGPWRQISVDSVEEDHVMILTFLPAN